jgi:hypothetical protein
MLAADKQSTAETRKGVERAVKPSQELTLDIVGSPHELNTGESASWNYAGTMAWLGAPGDTFSFDVTDE